MIILNGQTEYNILEIDYIGEKKLLKLLLYLEAFLRGPVILGCLFILNVGE
jgi:hypothetical protein